MRVKHWAGYGCVNAKCTSRNEDKVSIEVWGNHERGLEPRYFNCDDWMRWLGKRFKVNMERFFVSTNEWWDDKSRTDKMTVVFVRYR